MLVCLLRGFSCVQLFATLRTVGFLIQEIQVHQAPLSMGFSRQEYWNVLPCPASGDLPDPRDRSTWRKWQDPPANAGDKSKAGSISLLGRPPGGEEVCRKLCSAHTSGSKEEIEIKPLGFFLPSPWSSCLHSDSILSAVPLNLRC